MAANILEILQEYLLSTARVFALLSLIPFRKLLIIAGTRLVCPENCKSKQLVFLFTFVLSIRNKVNENRYILTSQLKKQQILQVLMKIFCGNHHHLPHFVNPLRNRFLLLANSRTVLVPEPLNYQKRRLLIN